jgi:hypothetical protein
MIAALSLLVAPSLLAQREVVRPSQLGQLGFQLDRLEQLMKERAAGIRRDAFIVSQVVSGIGDLEDFQHNAALQKAHDRVETAQRRARENPAASPQVLTALSQTMDLVDAAQKQGATADLAALKRDMLRNTHVIQQVLFRELQDSRADRQAMTDLQSRLARMSTDLDQAMDEALGSTFNYFRAGGQ